MKTVIKRHKNVFKKVQKKQNVYIFKITFVLVYYFFRDNNKRKISLF